MKHHRLLVLVLLVRLSYSASAQANAREPLPHPHSAPLPAGVPSERTTNRHLRLQRRAGVPPPPPISLRPGRGSPSRNSDSTGEFSGHSGPITGRFFDPVYERFRDRPKAPPRALGKAGQLPVGQWLGDAARPRSPDPWVESWPASPTNYEQIRAPAQRHFPQHDTNGQSLFYGPQYLFQHNIAPPSPVHQPEQPALVHQPKQAATVPQPAQRAPDAQRAQFPQEGLQRQPTRQENEMEPVQPQPVPEGQPLPIKRGRGRPRKIIKAPPQSVPEGQPLPINRGRGRPFKIIEVQPQTIKPGRGRPRKTIPHSPPVGDRAVKAEEQPSPGFAAESVGPGSRRPPRNEDHSPEAPANSPPLLGTASPEWLVWSPEQANIGSNQAPFGGFTEANQWRPSQHQPGPRKFKFVSEFM